MSDSKDKFNSHLDLLLRNKRDNTIIPRQQKRDHWIARLINIQTHGPKVNEDYNLKRRYEVVRIGDEYRLIKRRSGSDGACVFVAAFEEIYSAVYAAHSAVGHGGEKKTFNETRKTWANITNECCNLFISFCIECQERKKRSLPKVMFFEFWVLCMNKYIV